MKEEKKNKNINKKNSKKSLIFNLLLISMVLTFFYSVLGINIKLLNVESIVFRRDVDEYIMVLFQSLCGLFAMYLPNMIEKRWNVEFTPHIIEAYTLFLYASIVLGEFRNFYYKVPHWDTILHMLSGVLLALFGYSLITLLNDSEKILLKLSPAFIGLFTFCFAVALGVIWEIFEFTADGLLNMNMQKFALESAENLVGRDALKDTMKDLIVDSIGALIISTIGYIRLKEHKGTFKALVIRKNKENKNIIGKCLEKISDMRDEK